MEQTLESRVINIIAKNQKISPADIRLEQLIEEVCEDSLDIVQMLFALEDEFNIDIPDEAKELKTIGDIVRGIAKLVALKEKTEATVA